MSRLSGIAFGCLLILFSVGNPSLVFGQSSTFGIVFLSNRSGIYQVYRMEIDGSNIQQLTNETADVTDVTCSGDGQYISITGNHAGIKTIRISDNSVTMLYDTDFSSFYSSPSWSPDGNKIAFTSTRDGGWDIYTANTDGSNITRITFSPEVRERELTWSPSGNKLAFSSVDTNSTGIFVVNVDGSNLVRLTTNQMLDYFPDWSPDGTKIIFASEQQGQIGLYTINTDGMNHALVISTSNVANWRPSWSPNGNMIAFSSSRDGNPEIYVMNADGSSQQRLTTDNGNDLNACWLTPLPQSNGKGLRGQYFDTATFTTPKFFRLNPTIDFNWTTHSPDTAIAVDTFSIRWTGKVEPLYSEMYTFYVSVNDDAHLWVNGQQIIGTGMWTNRTTETELTSIPITLAAGVKYAITLEYYENTGAAAVHLRWSSPSQPKQVIPAHQLYPPEGQLRPRLGV